VVRSYDSFQDLADEVGDSRIYIGFHFRSAIRDGAHLGRHVGQWTFHHALEPLKHPRCDAF